MPIKFQCAYIIYISVCHITAKQFHYSSTCKKKCWGWVSTQEINSSCTVGILCLVFDIWVLVFTKNWSPLGYFFPIIFIIFHLDVGYNNLVYFILVAKILPDCFISIKSSLWCYCLPAVRYENTWIHSWIFFSFQFFGYVKSSDPILSDGYRIYSIILKWNFKPECTKQAEILAGIVAQAQDRKGHWWMCV